MHRFIGYISDLLFLHDCVIIPGFGGFICNYRSAYIDEDSGLICPPSKDILFNRKLVDNDGLLVNWIADKENVSYEKASVRLTLFAEDLKVRLNQEQFVQFGNIGQFYTDRRFNIHFDSCRSNFYAEAFGMEPVGILVPGGYKRNPARIPVSPVSVRREQYYPDSGAPGNVLHRLFKYAMAAATIAGIVIVTQPDVFHNGQESAGRMADNSTFQPGVISTFSPMHSGKVVCNSVISPEEDYVDYDPLADSYPSLPSARP